MGDYYSDTVSYYHQRPMQGISGATPVEEYVDIHTSFDPYNGDIIATDRANGGALSMIKQNDGTYHIKGPRRLIQILGGRSEIGGDGGILSHIHDGKLYDL